MSMKIKLILCSFSFILYISFSYGQSLCGPPSYCANTSLTTIQTPSAPFSTSTLTNSTTIDPVSNYIVLRVTDPNTGGGICGNDNQFNTTSSGGSADVMTNT